MRLLEYLVEVFIQTFGITRPTEAQRRRVTFLLGGALLAAALLVVAVGVGDGVLSAYEPLDGDGERVFTSHSSSLVQGLDQQCRIPVGGGIANANANFSRYGFGHHRIDCGGGPVSIGPAGRSLARRTTESGTTVRQIHSGGVSMVRQRSDARCQQGYSWGYDHRGYLGGSWLSRRFQDQHLPARGTGLWPRRSGWPDDYLLIQ